MAHCVFIRSESGPGDCERPDLRCCKIHQMSPRWGSEPEKGQDREAWLRRTFDCLSLDLEDLLLAALATNRVPDLLAVVDMRDDRISSIQELDPLQTKKTHSWAVVVGMLVLAFPEVHWVLEDTGSVDDAPLLLPGTPKHKLSPHVLAAGDSPAVLVSLHDEGFSPLFDPTGLATEIRKAAAKLEAKRPAAPGVPLRSLRAAAIDEETSYAYLNAYTAYRNGYRCHIVSTCGMMKRLFGRDIAATADDVLLMEDLFLRFPDLDTDQLANEANKSSESFHLSQLRVRDEIFPALAEHKCRVVVTVGHERVPADIVADNHAYVDELRQTGVRFWWKYKPIPGVYGAWSDLNVVPKGSFVWPPPDPGKEMPPGGHSAHGRLLVIARRLTVAASRILAAGPSTVEQALYGATLAINAKELLAHRTPTASLEALALQYELEVAAECMFLGVAYHSELRQRFPDLKSEVASAGAWFKDEPDDTRLKFPCELRRAAELDAGITLAGRLAARYRAYNQFDEELECLTHVGKMHWRLLLFRHRFARAALSWYAAFVTRGILQALFVIFVWIATLTVLFTATRHPCRDVSWGASKGGSLMALLLSLQCSHPIHSRSEERRVGKE